MVGLKRLLSVVFALILVLIVAGSGWADEGFSPPPTDPNRTTLTSTYPPDSLAFYTAPGLKYAGKRMTNSIFSSLFSFTAMLADWTFKATDYAWNFNLARWTGGLIDPVNTKIGDVVWKFGGLILSITALWIVVKVWHGQFARVTGGLMVLSIVLTVAVLSRNGISAVVADIEDAAGELAGEVLTAGADPGETAATRMTSISDGLYLQLILHPWAKANFASLEAARKPEYMGKGIPGDRFLGNTDKEAEEEFKRAGGAKNDDLWPWYSDGSIQRRAMVTFSTLISVLLVIPVMLALSLLVIGAKALTVIFAMGLPVAVFLAALPVFSGLRFLKGYLVFVCVGPISTLVCSFVVALYTAFLGGLMGAADQIPGGWLTISLILFALGFATYVFWRPIIRLFASLLTKQKTKTRTRQVVSRPPNYQPRVQPQGRMTTAGQVVAIRSLNQQRPAQPAASGANQTPQRVQTTSPSTRSVRSLNNHPRYQHQQQRRSGRLPEFDLLDVLREARRVVRYMAKVAANAGEKRQ